MPRFRCAVAVEAEYIIKAPERWKAGLEAEERFKQDIEEDNIEIGVYCVPA